MAYSKTLITDPRPTGFTDYDTERLYETISVVNTNLTAIEQEFTNLNVEGTSDVVGGMLTGNTETGITVTYQDADNTIDFEVAYGAEEPGAISAADSGSVGVANSAARSDHSHDFTYFATTTTLGDLGVPAPDPAYSGVLTGITVTSTIAELLAAIDSHTHT
jgi:hypothetical protein